MGQSPANNFKALCLYNKTAAIWQPFVLQGIGGLYR